MRLREFYCEKYPSDEFGKEINEEATFLGLYQTLLTNQDVYRYIGENDSIIRERLFAELALRLNVRYDYIYYLWLDSVDSGFKMKKSYCYTLWIENYKRTHTSL